MRILTTIAMLGLCSPFTAGEPENTQPIEPTPEIKLDLIEPDWSLLGDGNWSPWFVDASGETVWNPSASFNAWMDTIPEADKAWPILVDVYYKHFDVLGWENYALGAWPAQREDQDENGVDDWAQVVAILKEPGTQEIIDQLNVAFSKPHMGAKMRDGLGPIEYEAMVKYKRNDENDQVKDQVDNPDVLSCYPPFFSLVKHGQELLLSHAYLMAIEGDMEGFTKQIMTALDSTRLFSNRKSVISNLVAGAGQRRVFRAILWALYKHGEQLNDDQLQSIEQAVQRNFIVSFENIEDSLQFHDAVRRVFNMPEMARSAGNFSSVDPLSTPYTKLTGSVRRTLALYDMPIQGASAATNFHANHEPEPKWYFDAWGYDRLKLDVDFIGKQMLNMFEMALEPSINICVEVQTYSDAVRLAIAAHRQRLRNGDFPVSTEAIERDLLGFTPQDPFTRGLLTYKISPEFGPMIYSVGNDLDDDSGRHDPRTRLFAKEYDSDFLFYPDPYLIEIGSVPD